VIVVCFGRDVYDEYQAAVQEALRSPGPT
jgi:hypothetical protein